MKNTEAGHTYIFHHIFLQILHCFFLQRSLRTKGPCFRLYQNIRICLWASHHSRKLQNSSSHFLLFKKTIVQHYSLFRPQISCYLKVDPVDSVSHVLEHALEGHEEVSVFEACLTARGFEKGTKV